MPAACPRIRVQCASPTPSAYGPQPMAREASPGDEYVSDSLIFHRKSLYSEAEGDAGFHAGRLSADSCIPTAPPPTPARAAGCAGSSPRRLRRQLFHAGSFGLMMMMMNR